MIKALDHRASLLLGSALFLAAGPALAEGARAPVMLPQPPAPFAGRIAPNTADATPDFPRVPRAPKGAPNVLLVLTDDVGFAAVSSFGGPVPTPALDRLAGQGLRYTRFHTAAMCSPTRAALLTGRNPHAVGNGTVVDLSTGYPGYWSVIPRSAATVAEVLRQNGYNTGFFGKHHNVPDHQSSPAGPFDLWPTGLGFEYFYGFIGAETNQFTPALFRGTRPVEAPRGVMLDQALADDAITWVHNQKAGDPDKPFFLYFAPGSAHEPHQAPADWIARFRGRFDAGWDALRADSFQRQKAMGIVPADAALSPRPDGIPAWDSLTPDQQRVQARFMEVFAAMLAFQDHQVGRLLDELQRMGELDNTLVMFIEGDNGAAAEAGFWGSTNAMAGFANGMTESQEYLLANIDALGGPTTRQNYGVGWAWAINAPFPFFKQFASHLGGTRNGLVVSWPARIKDRGALRTQFHHVVDVAPTILEAAGVAQPDTVNGTAQQRVDGVSMAYSFADARAADRRRTQYFEVMGNRALYHEGWLAGTTPKRVPWAQKPFTGSADPDGSYEWELYDLRRDYAQTRNLASANPAKLQELKALWRQEAERNQVLPLDDRLSMDRFAAAAQAYGQARTRFVYWGKDVSVPAAVAPPLANHSYRITVQLDGGGRVPDGVLASLGSRFGGWSFYVRDGRPAAVVAASQMPGDSSTVTAPARLGPGAAAVQFDYTHDGGPNAGGMMRISIDGKQVAEGRVNRTLSKVPEMTDSFNVGFDADTPVTDAYADGGRFTGTIGRLQVDVGTP